MYLVVSTSLNAASQSRRLAVRSANLLESARVPVQFLDLAQYQLPMHDGSSELPREAAPLRSTVGSATGILLVAPVYYGDLAVSARNFLHLVGEAWRRKVVAFACVAGDRRNHPVVLHAVNWLMIEHRVFVIPDFVFTESHLVSESLRMPQSNLEVQLKRLTDTLQRVTTCLSHA